MPFPPPSPARALVGLAALTALPMAAPGQQLTAADRARAVATVWSEARYNFAYWARVRADWDSALTAMLALAGARQGGGWGGDQQFFHALRRMVALLSDGRTDVTPAPAVLSRLGRPPLLVRSVEGRPFILDYAENDEMRVARPERLAEIVAVQGIPVADWIRDSTLPETPGATASDRWRRAVEGLLEGPKETALQLVLRLPGGATRGASVTRSVGLTERWPFGRRALEVDTLPDHAIWVRLNSFDDPEVVQAFDRAFERFTGVPGVIIDLRDNDAGPSEPGYEILARLTDKPFLTPRWRAPQFVATTLTWFSGPPDTVPPRRDRAIYTGPIAVLISRRTAGAAEDFLAAFRHAARGSVIGEPTAGSAGRGVTIPLPHGWRFQVCATRHAFPDSVEYGGTGIAPEQPVDVKVEDLLAGRDAALERARQYLRTRN